MEQTLYPFKCKVYSAGKDIISIDWTSLKVSIISDLKESVENDGYVGLSLENGYFRLFFPSGNFFSLKFRSWSSFERPSAVGCSENKKVMICI